MMTISTIIISMIAMLIIASTAIRVVFRDQLSENSAVAIADMYRCERIIDNKYERLISKYRKGGNDGEYVDIYELAEFLKLEIVKANESDLPKNVKGLLDAPSKKGYNGKIKYVADGERKYFDNFVIIHEIIHYLHDVGVGRQVDHSFARVHHGYRRNYQEQIRDYFTAAAAIPIESLLERIGSYDGDPHDKNFIEKLMDVYQQPYETVERRIKEVMILV